MLPSTTEPRQGILSKYTKDFRIKPDRAVYFWKNIANFVNMKSDITFLPERKQRDLHELVALIREEIRDVVMIILYGSYAKNTYVDLDERHDFGVRTYYMERLRPAGRYAAAAGCQGGDGQCTDQGAFFGRQGRVPDLSAAYQRKFHQTQPCALRGAILLCRDRKSGHPAL